MADVYAILVGLLAVFNAHTLYKLCVAYTKGQRTRHARRVLATIVAAFLFELIGAGIIDLWTELPLVAYLLIPAAYLRQGMQCTSKNSVLLAVAVASACARIAATSACAYHITLTKSQLPIPLFAAILPEAISSAALLGAAVCATFAEIYYRARKRSADKEPSEKDPLIPKGVTANATTLQQLPPTHQPPASQAHERQKWQRQNE